ncbi:MAG: hypothetical protein ACPMAQ_08440 [Phycisphaerae bacterium]
MEEYDLDSLILIVTGSTLRAEDKDRPLANALAVEIRKRLPPDSSWRCLVISDLHYINNEDLHECPLICLGGPGVNHLSAILLRELPPALAVDRVLLIQMDVQLKDLRTCLWGMNHDTTVEAIQTFIQKGYLDRFLAAVVASDSV